MSELGEAHSVEEGWEQVRRLSRLEHRRANQLLADALEAERAHAAETLTPLKPWPLLPKTSFGTYTRGPNHVRIRRVLDFIRPGSRVLDIGIGYGYLTSVLIRDTGLSYYCGVDLTQRYIDTTQQGLLVNGLLDCEHHLEILDLYDLSPEFVARHRPDIVLLLEVLEHVPDAELAFDALGRAIDTGCSVLFTVPLLGRLEGVWGHLSLYDEARIVELCRRAGMTIQHVEPVHNTWVLVLARRSDDTLTTSTPPGSSAVSEKLAGTYSFEAVDFDGDVSGLATGRLDDLSLGRDGLSFSVAPGARGGVLLPIHEPEVARIEISFAEPENLVEVVVEGTGRRRPSMSWRWLVSDRNRPGERPVTFVLRNGRRARELVPVAAHGPAGTTHLGVWLMARRRASTGATIRRAAFVPRADATAPQAD